MKARAPEGHALLIPLGLALALHGTALFGIHLAPRDAHVPPADGGPMPLLAEIELSPVEALLPQPFDLGARAAAPVAPSSPAPSVRRLSNPSRVEAPVTPSKSVAPNPTAVDAIVANASSETHSVPSGDGADHFAASKGDAATSAAPNRDGRGGGTGLGSGSAAVGRLGSVGHGPLLHAKRDVCRGLFPHSSSSAHGVVVVALEIDTRGTPRAPRVTSEFPRGEGFAAAARECVPRLHFAPATNDAGQPVASTSKVRLRFERAL